jgi:hypothetical protein
MNMLGLNADQSVLDAADDCLLRSVREFIDLRGGFTESVGGVEVVLVSMRKFYVVVHCEGIAPPRPGMPADG